MKAWQSGLKRAVDVILAAGGLAVLSPLLLAVAALVRLTSSGPALFRQGRLGCSGVPFNIYKFRSMLTDAPDIRNEDGSAFSGEDDPRVTGIGKFLRKSSIDELPQLFNVLKGDMSLVGPRPDQVDQIRYYSNAELEKLTVKPGITGLAQISGRNGISWEERKRLDLEYVRKQSLLGDAQILLRTIPCVLMRRDIFIKS